MSHAMSRTMSQAAIDPAATARWTHAAVSRLVEHARAGASAEVISLRLSRPVAEVRAKAAELGLSLKLAG